MQIVSTRRKLTKAILTSLNLEEAQGEIGPYQKILST